MVVCNSGITHIQSPWSFLLPFMVISILFFLPLPSAALSFNFTSIDPNNTDIKYERDADPSDGIIQLTFNKVWSAGRATYAEPMQLGNKSSRSLANFETHFSFVIQSNDSNSHGDGLAFFLAPIDSRIPPNWEGSGLGLVSRDGSVNSFVAVEFDTVSNNWDPEFDHVGIDINSVKSVDNVRWWSSIKDGKRVDVWISYDSSQRNLSVTFTNFGADNTTTLGNLYYIVDLRDYLPEWVTFGFSGATAVFFEIHSIYSWSFSSSLQNFKGETNQTSPVPVTPNLKRERRKNTGLVVGLSVGACILVGGLGLVWLWLWKRRGRGEDEDEEEGPDFDAYMDGEFEKGTGPKKFEYNELARATNNFAEKDKLGEGGFGGVYGGFLRSLNSYVAIKKVSSGSQQGMKEYASEVKIISRLRHRNLVQLIGWCHEKKELLLVYEFMPNGSLDAHLFKGKSLLTWAVRFKIAVGLASALIYLHEEWEQCVVHRDIKASNIMLDSNFNAKLGDFGMARLVDHEKGSQTTLVAGTMGYIAPECVMTGKASKESDVYSFGVVALEIACGRKPIEPRAEENQIMMVEWVWELYGIGKLLEAADRKLCTDFDEEQMECLMIVGLWCAHPDYNLRPSIRQAIHVLNFEAPLPILPSKMPMPTYFAPSVNMSALSLSSSHVTSTTETGQTHISSNSNSTNSSKLIASSAASSPSASLLYSR